MKKLSAALAGTLIAFTWILLSRMTLPWYTHEFQPFQDEKVMGIVLKDQTPNSGLYTFPAVPGPGATLAQKYHWYESAAQGPFYFLAVKNQESRLNIRDRLLIKLAVQFLISLILVWILSRCQVVHPLQAGLLAGVVVFCGALSEDLRAWNWWSLPDDAALLNLADVFIRWFLAGIVMAMVMGRNETKT